MADIWSQANPLKAIRCSAEPKPLGSGTFAVERLAIGEWPDISDPQKGATSDG